MFLFYFVAPCRVAAPRHRANSLIFFFFIPSRTKLNISTNFQEQLRICVSQIRGWLNNHPETLTICGVNASTYLLSYIENILNDKMLDLNAEIINSYNVHALLFDTYNKDKLGGTGSVFNWDKIRNFQIDTSIILSGGLSSANVVDGIDAVCPSAVDINSGVESKPGIKDEKKRNHSSSALHPCGEPAFL